MILKEDLLPAIAILRSPEHSLEKKCELIVNFFEVLIDYVDGKDAYLDGKKLDRGETISGGMID